MATVAPPPRNDISGTAPNPSNAVARAGFGTLWDYVTNLLGVTGSPTTACTALGAYQKTSILGTVSQSAGVPTGAIIETGSNANGIYTKWADGTMICVVNGVGTGTTSWSTSSNFYYSGPTSFTFPATFSAAPTVVMNAQDPNVVSRSAYVSSFTPTATGINDIYLTSPSNTSPSTASVVRIYIATGRWF
jgi:hypothetical protein